MLFRSVTLVSALAKINPTTGMDAAQEVIDELGEIGPRMRQYIEAIPEESLTGMLAYVVDRLQARLRLE